VLVPTSEYEDLLQLEEWGKWLDYRYRIDTSNLEFRVEWYRGRLELKDEPLPWYETPTTQRWFGRLEVLVTVGLAAYGLRAIGER
jgi:hypothetical protein